MQHPVLYRKRLIPDELIRLDSDIVLECNDDTIVTKWNTIRPKADLHHGCSCYFLQKGWKVSKFYGADNSLMYWYCDIVDYQIDQLTDSVIATDLLADVLIYPDGFVKVVDMDELAIACQTGKISKELLEQSLFRLNELLTIIYNGEFKKLQQQMEAIEKRS